MAETVNVVVIWCLSFTLFIGTVVETFKQNVYLNGGTYWLYVIIMSRTRFRVNPHSIVCLNVKELLGQGTPLSDSNAIRIHNQLVRKWTKWLSVRYELSGCGFESRCGDTYVRGVWSRLRTKSNGIPWSDITREISCW